MATAQLQTRCQDSGARSEYVVCSSKICHGVALNTYKSVADTIDGFEIQSSLPNKSRKDSRIVRCSELNYTTRLLRLTINMVRRSEMTQQFKIATPISWKIDTPSHTLTAIDIDQVGSFLSEWHR